MVLVDFSLNFAKIRKNILILLRQDECIFKQFLVNKKAWSVNKNFYIQPKDDGTGIMVSAFQSHVFGFGIDLSAEDYDKVNKERRGKEYLDKIAVHKQF